jgi:hypothetical protein
MNFQFSDNEYWTLVNALECALAYWHNATVPNRVKETQCESYQQLLERLTSEYERNGQ